MQDFIFKEEVNCENCTFFEIQELTYQIDKTEKIWLIDIKKDISSIPNNVKYSSLVLKILNDCFSLTIDKKFQFSETPELTRIKDILEDYKFSWNKI